jgi:hypothetical protein
MAKLFRKGRFQFFQTKGFGGYLVYVVLEMVLVVAGILIALEINNRNEQAKNDEKALAILAEVRRDLRANLQEMKGVAYLLNQKDSLIRRIMVDSVRAEDYRRDFNYAGLIMTYARVQVQRNGLQNMNRHGDYFSQGYDTLYSDLEELYGEDYAAIESMQERLEDYVIHRLEAWAEEKEWFYQIARGRLPEEAVLYMAESPYYRNSVEIYRTYAINNMYATLRMARMKTVRNLIEISKRLEPEGDPYADYVGYLIPFKAPQWTADTGRYTLRGLQDFRLRLEGNSLRFAAIGQPSFEVYPQNDSTLYFPTADIHLILNREQGTLSLKQREGVQVLSKMK